jgi:ATP phosphoribosyltransferase regulatory subunit
MSDPLPHSGLLPTGLIDALPPDAERDSLAAERALNLLAAYGYQQVSPPLLEFEESFLSGAGEPVARETFRIMDPASQRMLVLRSDMTPQISRIAASRLGNVPRPLRLCYIGQVLRVSGGRPGAERQLRQAGAELIGSSRPEADAEIILLAAAALRAIGVQRVAVDLNVPHMASSAAVAAGLIDSVTQEFLDALDRKDISEIVRVAPKAADLLGKLIDAGGDADSALSSIDKVQLDDGSAKRVNKLRTIVDLVRRETPDLSLTIDYVEHRGFDYYSDVAFSLFAKGRLGELGRGGRYQAPVREGGDPHGEPAVGFSLFMSAVGQAAQHQVPPSRVFLPYGINMMKARHEIRLAGCVAVSGLDPNLDPYQEAKRLECQGLWHGGKIEFFKEG